MNTPKLAISITVAFAVFYVVVYLSFHGGSTTAVDSKGQEPKSVPEEKQPEETAESKFNRLWSSAGVMMSITEARTIVKYLKPEHVVFEWGSGYSTGFFSKFVRSWQSVEHDKNWFERVKAMTKHQSNVFLGFVAANDAKKLQERPSRSSTYSAYIQAIDSVQGPIDRVLVDGRARPQCALHALAKLRGPNSLVFIHDWHEPRRVYYRIVLDFFDVVEAVEMGQGIVVLKPKEGALEMYRAKTSWPEWW